MTIKELKKMYERLPEKDKQTLRKTLEDAELALAPPVQCPECNSAEHVTRSGKRGKKKRYACQKCGKFFVAGGEKDA